ncbi:major facilitator superfamily domain-containing protein [Annulohypoxylon truncatum]|uniref:major facilitator superfamily domain-containing protein n=1 Tax=Annulohypoxylon truncatum TaxID=327061 RepID=UPI002007BF9D|nr:major facilitator superfamily domain-containing protein [Annulohypoxylon truncatum]KAI1212610.1 major facilitator superfamily domain-containing protein [Annulohypoxylon truncatum]
MADRELALQVPDSQVEVRTEKDESESFKPSWRIWTIFLVLCMLSLMASIDSTIITTSLPTVTREVGGAGQYVWIANSYLFACTVPQPLYGQIANIFGRRNPLFVAIALFTLGSGIAGGSHNVVTLIAGRTIQGLGSGGLYVLSDIIICDLVPSRYRGPYISAVLSTAAIGATIGPIIGGALAQANWRWIFWINLPVMGVGLLAIALALNVQYKRSPTWLHAISRVDFLGNAIFIPSMTAIFFGLIMGGQDGYPWGSWRIILPLVLGVLGWVAFHVHQSSRICREPSMPTRLFKHRTSAAGFLMIFLAAVIMQATGYFLPVYFQAVKGVTPLMSGVSFLPFALAIIPFGGLAGAFLSKTGLYKPLHWAGFALSAVGTGLFSTLREDSSRGAWIGFQIIAAGGIGLVFTATLPSTLAALPESDVAVATGTYSFVRSLGLVWGATMAAIAFNGQVDAHLNLVADAGIRRLLVDGGAYTSAGKFTALPDPARGQVIRVYELALRATWLVFVGVACLGFLVAFVEKHVVLRKDHSTEFGLAEKPAEEEKAEKGVDISSPDTKPSSDVD